MVLKVNDKAPNFELEGTDDKNHTLKNYKDKKLVLYFYPKDNTPGCTTQACTFSDGYKELEKAGYTVLGVSADSIKSHKKFKEKYNLSFELLSDPEKKTIKDYKALKEKSMFGNTFLGIQRCTYVIEKGIITKVIPKSSPKEAVNEILS
ncbi:MAG: peroxiredoxin [Candidatus Woesearchaeota archaeon]